jgi:FAD:protein FMN transferase
LSRFEFSEPQMGTVFKIVLYAPDRITALRSSKAAFGRIAALDNTMSDYRADSELMRLCQQAGGPPVKVSEDLFRVLAAAQQIAQQSDGAFDVTVGPVVRLWRMARLSERLPDPERLAHAVELVGYTKLRLDPAARTVQLLQPHMLLDLGGIGKGFAAEEALVVLKRYGITSALVAGGGDIAVSDPPPKKAGWTIGIASLVAPDSSPQRYVVLHHAGISTSGDVEQHVEIAGRRYSHVVDPRTGQALVGRRSVTVIAPDGTTADGLATAVSVLGPERGLELIKSMPGTSALFVQDTDRSLRTFECKFPADPSRR